MTISREPGDIALERVAARKLPYVRFRGSQPLVLGLVRQKPGLGRAECPTLRRQPILDVRDPGGTLRTA